MHDNLSLMNTTICYILPNIVIIITHYVLYNSSKKFYTIRDHDAVNLNNNLK